MNKYLCIHCHFYQPPRENPWLEEIEYQESAYPYHDWNEKITIESYWANAFSRIMDEKGWITQLVNNYSKISFNFGPTLLSWLEKYDKSTYEAILLGDKKSIENYGGHGSALAQAYNHVILPLATRRDKEIQVKWGIRDFQTRFGRYPESMWLPETAVDTETLEVLSFFGMKYVILAPRQAKAYRSLVKDKPWQNTLHDNINPRRPYLIKLPSGSSIVAFFYDGPISQAVAFEGLLHNGEIFANRLMQGFINDPKENQLCHIATDGETYGHHHRYGDMALAYAIHHLESQNLAQMTNYGFYLENNPEIDEAQIFDNSSWSCVHGVERWRSNCGCHSGAHQNWHQKWRTPLRDTFDFIRDTLSGPYENAMKEFTNDPWKLRDHYIDVILNRSETNLDDFLEKNINFFPDEIGQQKIFKCLEMQRQLQLMYTSCAWFFDDITGIETLQNIQYAYRAIQLAEDLFGLSLEGAFIEKLSHAPSNNPDFNNGADIFERLIKPTKVDFLKLGAHFGVSALFEDPKTLTNLYCFDFKVHDFKKKTSGRAGIAIGHVGVKSKITHETSEITFGVMHFGDQNLNVGVRFFKSQEIFDSLIKKSFGAFEKADFPQVIRVFDQNFGSHLFSLRDLFKDEQKKVTDVILHQTLNEIENEFNQIYERYFPLMRYFSEIKTTIPKVFEDIAKFVKNRGIENTLLMDEIDINQIKQHIEEAKNLNLTLNFEGLKRFYRQTLEYKLALLESDMENAKTLEEILELVKTTKELPFTVDLGSAQNSFYVMYKNQAGQGLLKSAKDDVHKDLWLKLFESLANELKIKV